METKRTILSADAAQKKLRRMALEVVEQNYTSSELVLIGIRKSGSVIARRISAYLQEAFKGSVTVLELTMDKKNPGVIRIEPLIDFNNKTILLIDDVANSGRTMLYALKPLLEQHPARIQTLALVERTHKAFPVGMVYVGLSVSTTTDEHIYVEVDGEEVLGAWMD